MDCGYYEELIEDFRWEGKVVKFHTKRELCLPYEQNWSPYKQIGHDNPKLAIRNMLDSTIKPPNMISTDILSVPPIYTELDYLVTESEVDQYCDMDYVVMGPIGRKNWIETLWERLVEVR